MVAGEFLLAGLVQKVVCGTDAEKPRSLSRPVGKPLCNRAAESTQDTMFFHRRDQRKAGERIGQKFLIQGLDGVKAGDP